MLPLLILLQFSHRFLPVHTCVYLCLPLGAGFISKSENQRGGLWRRLGEAGWQDEERNDEENVSTRAQSTGCLKLIYKEIENIQDLLRSISYVFVSGLIIL